MAYDLLESITLEGSVRNVNFFNGRLLTAGDLIDEQAANRTHHEQVGQAIGAGVVRGLEVRALTTTTTNPTVCVKAGLALNRQGQALELPQEVVVALIQAEETAAADAGLFAVCQPPEATAIPTGTGVYVLVLSPASVFEERAPKTGLGDGGIATTCDSRYAVEGVQFRLIQLNVANEDIVQGSTATQVTTLMQQESAASESRLRNILAHLCLATSRATGRSQDPFLAIEGAAPYRAYGALDALYDNALLDPCDVPLCLLFWNQQGIRFVDQWAVRRLARLPVYADAFSRFRGYGLERLYQFIDHLDALADTLGGLASLRVHEYFRFLPPVGYFPVTGAGSVRGFHDQRFFEAHVTITRPADLSAGKLAALLQESFVHEAIDLDLEPERAIALYAVRENAQAVAAGENDQRYLAFTSRALHGPRAQDGVAETFSAAWEVYRGLVQQRTFLPAPEGEEAINARNTITAAIQDVMAMANRMAALAGGRTLDTGDALEAFDAIHRIQDELATLFVSDIPGIVHTQNREEFGDTLAVYLDESIPGGAPGLAPSIAAGDLRGAVDAQDAINGFVGQWSGEGVAIGPFGFVYRQSPRGTLIVPGDTEPYPHEFAFSNRTDKELTFDLDAQVTAPTGNWDGRATFADASGGAISSVTVASGASVILTVNVRAADDGVEGETATLSLTASVPPPTDRVSTSLPLDLTVADEAGDPVSQSVSIESVQVPVGIDLNAVPSGTILSFTFNFLYAAPDGPSQADFLVTASMASSPPGLWIIEFPNLGAGDTATSDLPSGTFTRTLTLSTGGSSQVEMLVAMLTIAPGTASIAVNIASTNLDPAISVDMAEPLAIQMV